MKSFLFLSAIFALPDPDPDIDSKSGYGSTGNDARNVLKWDAMTGWVDPPGGDV
jgi:hypothetical protein